MNTFARYLWARLQEPSTWAGLSIVGTLAGLPPGTIDLVHQVVLGVGGLAAVVLAEKPTPDAP